MGGVRKTLTSRSFPIGFCGAGLSKKTSAESANKQRSCSHRDTGGDNADPRLRGGRKGGERGWGERRAEDRGIERGEERRKEGEKGAKES